MTGKEVWELILEGESQFLEFKETFQNETLETIGAFANTEGGKILVGVRNNGDVTGREISEETVLQMIGRIGDVTEPKVIPYISMVEVEGKSVCVIEITEYPLKPVAVRGRCFRRVGSSNRVMTPGDIAQMHLFSTGSSWDALPVPRKSMGDIDLELVRLYMKKATESGRGRFPENADPEEVLRKMELIVDGNPTWASILLFGKEPQSPLVASTVHSGRFRTDIDITDDIMIR